MRQSQARGSNKGPKRTVRTRKIIDTVDDTAGEEEQTTAQSLNWLAHNEGHFSDDELRAELRLRRTKVPPA